ncbi:H-NS histone family protein [Burkholderia cenocepacia]|uniref:H-NS histone family protein n=1 Tax=Burkholderia cenocepacia TaxID=95486 RepID=UPI001E2D4AFC|nr:H-NS histone family protein [Burkholderia cenocepacia]
MTKVVNGREWRDYAWVRMSAGRRNDMNERFGEQVMLIYRSFVEKKALLEAQLERERLAIAATVLIEVRRCVEEFGFTSREVFPAEDGMSPRKRRAKYFNPQTGQTWSGVGREPAWMRGQDRSRFVLDAAPVDSDKSEDS